MSPVQTFQQLLQVDRSVARVLLAGMCIFAASAIVLSYGIDFNTSAITGAFIVAMGTVLIFISFILDDGVLKRVIGWLITLFFFLVLFTLFFAAVSPGQTLVKPIECLVRFWEKCENVGDAVAERNAPEITVKPIEDTPVAAVNRTDYRVFIQFAGYKREDIVSLAQTLNNAGWKVQAAAKGGERLAAAASLAEVRYGSAADEPAAKLLAQEVSASGVKGGVAAKQVSLLGGEIKPKTLEIWIGL